MSSDLRENMDFEAEVRRVAEAVWGLGPGDCNPKYYEMEKGISEIDGFAETRETINLIMVTVSARLDKIKSDVRKLGVAERLEKNPLKPLKKWMITKSQLDAQHIKHCHENGVTVKTLSQFSALFFDNHNYINMRRSTPFGSARDLSNGSTVIPEKEYIVPVMYLETMDVAGRFGKKRIVKVNDIVELLLEGEIIIGTAPFGSGKSMLVREVFEKLSKKVLSTENRTSMALNKTPIAINLREHWGQDYSEEILERHARKIGVKDKEGVNIAWRAGMAHMLIDGFDEIAGQIIARTSDIKFMRNARSKSLTGTRSLLSVINPKCGIFIVGRDHYFDDNDEMLHALGLLDKKINFLYIEEFTEEQAKQYLNKKGVKGDIPEWLPKKPLLLGYLAHNKMLDDAVKIDASNGFGYVWDTFIDLIVRREASHEHGVIDAPTLRKIMERLATAVRSSVQGNGPILSKDLSEAYTLETDLIPDEGVTMQLQRIPGLTQRDQDKGARSFVDMDMLGALQGSRIARFAVGEIYDLDSSSWKNGISQAAIETCIQIVKERSAGDIDVARLVFESCCKRLSSNFSAQNQSQLLADLFSSLIECSIQMNLDSISCNISIKGAVFENLSLDEISLVNINFTDCVINKLAIDTSRHKDIIFRSCIFSEISGITLAEFEDSPVFIDCQVYKCDEIGSNAAIMRSSLPSRMKALGTVTRKLYMQAGVGRRRNAFFRGSDSRDIRDDIEIVIKYLISQGYAREFNEVIYPNREFAQRMREIIENLSTSRDVIVQEILQA